MSGIDLMGTVYGEVLLPGMLLIPFIAVNMAIICNYWSDRDASAIGLKATAFAFIIEVILLLVWKYARIKK